MTSDARLDGILAPATAPGPAHRAVLRLSGPRLLAQAATFLPADLPRPQGQREVLQGEWQAFPGVSLPVTLLCFPGPHSATGEDVLELHLVSSAPALRALEEHLLEQGLRYAEPGEFTRRAFLNQRLDLTQAEAVLDLVHAHGAGEARQAASRLQGGLRDSLAETREALMASLVELEAGLDFEEGDSQDLEPGEIAQHLERAEEALREGLQAQGQHQLRARPAWEILLLGPANAGKTSLFQTLTGEGALVSSEAGTTRDRRDAPWHGLASVQNHADDLPWMLWDLPGLGGEAADARDLAARQQTEHDLASGIHADLLLLVLAPETQVEELPQLLPAIPTLLVWSQSDRQTLPSAALRSALARQLPADTVELRIGDQGRQGRQELEQAVAQELSRLAGQREARTQHSERHQAALQEALVAVGRAQEWVAASGPQDLVAEELRVALLALAALMGETTPEDLLDRLFSSFCIGK